MWFRAKNGAIWESIAPIWANQITGTTSDFKMDLINTKTVDSVEGARWLARQTPNILCNYYSLNLEKLTVRLGLTIIISNISSGTAWLHQGMFTTVKRRYNLNNRDKIVLQLKLDRCNKLINEKISKMEYN